MTVSRRGGRERRVAGTIRQLPFARLVNPYSPIEILGADQVEAIIDGAFTILESRGMRFLEAGSRKLLKAAGAEPVDDLGTMRIDRGLVREKLALVPPEFTLRARNRDHDLRIGGRNLVFTSVGGPAFVNDLDNGRRPGKHVEVCDFLKLVQSLNIIHQESGGPFEAMDLPPETRHLDLYLAQMTLLDKNCQAYALGRVRTVDCIEMTCIAHGITREELAREEIGRAHV